MGGANLQNQAGDELITTLRKNQSGKGYGAEGTCQAGNFVYAIVYLNVPMESLPTITISNIEYLNCSAAEVWKTSRFAFAVRATVTANGGAVLSFDWSASV